MDALIRETYAKDSTAANKNSLYDPYVKSLRWASDRIGKEGIVALVTNNSFLDGRAFDGMRKHLAADFDEIYILDLGGNARKDKLVADASVFGIRVGVSINLFVKRAARDRFSPSDGEQREPARIFYYRTDDAWNKDRKFAFLRDTEHVGNIPWQTPQTRRAAYVAHRRVTPRICNVHADRQQGSKTRERHSRRCHLPHVQQRCENEPGCMGVQLQPRDAVREHAADDRCL